MATPSPPPSVVAPPSGVRPVADAGVVIVQGADDRIYRYDGPTGTLDPVSARSTFDREVPDGVYAVGRHGGAALLRWDGSQVELSCGDGPAVSVAPSGACASGGGPLGVSVKLTTDREPRQILPADWGASGPELSADGRRLLLIRTIEPRAVPGMDPGLSALWLMEPDGRLRELFRPAGRGVLGTPMWSPDAKEVLVRQIETTSNSFAADGVGVSTILVDVASGTSRSLGATRSATWAPDGRLAFVRGGLRLTWWDKTLVVLGTDRRERTVTSDPGRVALAPSWGPHGELAWVSGPATKDYGGDGYIDGRGAGQRVGVIEIDGRRREIECGGGRVVEGIRWSAEAGKLLLLCRKPGHDPRPLELWLYRLKDDTSAALITGLGSDPLAGGFGFYGAQPPVTALAAWSLGVH